MSRKTIEKNISFDDQKNLYYVTMDYGKDSLGKRNKITKTFIKKGDAKQALKEFEANKTKGTIIFPSSVKFEEYANYWINDIKSLNC